MHPALRRLANNPTVRATATSATGGALLGGGCATYALASMKYEGQRPRAIVSPLLYSALTCATLAVTSTLAGRGFFAVGRATSQWLRGTRTNQFRK